MRSLNWPRMARPVHHARRRPPGRHQAPGASNRSSALARMRSNTGCCVGHRAADRPCSTSAAAVCRSSASLRFVEQPHVLDGDHRLVGEGLQQRPPGAGAKGPGSAPRDAHHADQLPATQKRAGTADACDTHPCRAGGARSPPGWGRLGFVPSVSVMRTTEPPRKAARRRGTSTSGSGKLSAFSASSENGPRRVRRREGHPACSLLLKISEHGRRGSRR